MPNELRMDNVMSLNHINRCFANSDWLPILQREFALPYMNTLRDFLRCEEDNRHTILPPAELVFEALHRTRLEDVKVVILGQEPYPNQGQADGLAFSMQETYAQRRSRKDSLKNIIREVNEDWAPAGSLFRYQNRLPDDHVCLRSWADQGVLLLNTVLTFREGERPPDARRRRRRPNAHDKGCAGKVWRRFTTEIIKAINCDLEYVVFMLWGSQAMKTAVHINRNCHKVLCALHPSYETGVSKTRHFSCANEYLLRNNRGQIEWLRRPLRAPVTQTTRRNSQRSAE